MLFVFTLWYNHYLFGNNLSLCGALEPPTNEWLKSKYPVSFPYTDIAIPCFLLYPNSLCKQSWSRWYCLSSKSSAVPPKIYDISSDVTVNEGSNVSLICAASGKPEPSISWRHITPSGESTSTLVGRCKKTGSRRRRSLAGELRVGNEWVQVRSIEHGVWTLGIWLMCYTWGCE